MINTFKGILKPGETETKSTCDVCVVIALYNQGSFIDEALKSVANNSILPCEVVIVNDCSTDNSAELLFKATLKYSDILNLHVVNHAQNKGLAGARNSGILETKANWIVCLDADDKLELNYFEQMIQWQKLSKADILYTDCEFFGSVKGKYQFPNFNSLVLRTRNICLASSLYSREVYEKCGKYDERFKHGLEDYALWLKACQLGFKFVKCETTGLYYRRHETSMTMTGIFSKYKIENSLLLKEVFGDYYIGR